MYVFDRYVVLLFLKHPWRILQATSHLGVVSPIPSRGSATQQNPLGEEMTRVSGAGWNWVGGLDKQKVCVFPDTWCKGTVPLLCEMCMGTSKAAARTVQPRARHRHTGHGLANQCYSREREEVPAVSKAWFAEMLCIFLVIFLSRLIMLNLIKTSSPRLLSFWSSLSPQPLLTHHLPSSDDVLATAFSELQTKSMSSRWIK